MIDFSKYNLQEMQAITTVLDDLTDEMSSGGYGNDFYIALNECSRAACVVADLIDQQARDHAAAEAESPADPPDMFGWVNDALDGLQV